MKPVDKQKMCSNCDGRISHEAIVCPYCGTEQQDTSNTNAFQAPLFKNQSLQDSLASLYTPPYTQKAPAYAVEEPVKKKAEPMRSARTEKPLISPQPQMTAFAAPQAEENSPAAKNSLIPILMLSFGGNLFLLGLLQFFFSSNGTLRLEWDASYWFIYCLLSLPLAYFGFKKLAK
jgi:hypothetical protein